MPCIINWDEQSPPQLNTVELAADGCIINWMKADKGMTSVNESGCIINWDAQTDIKAAVSNAQSGCVIDWDANTDLVSMSKATSTAQQGCIVNWLGVDEADLRAAAMGGCIINW